MSLENYSYLIITCKPSLVNQVQLVMLCVKVDLCAV